MNEPEPDPLDATTRHTGDITARDVSEINDELPNTIDRYRIESVLGKGGFGIVYLASDESLNRRVAIKVPSRRLIQKAGQAELYLEEARAVARLDHASIVPVYDVGNTELFPCFVVSKYIDGHSLAKATRSQRLTFRQSAEIVASVADALHFGHQRGIIHRDVKPANILLDRASKPHLVDYGLALQDRNPDPVLRCAGTPTYMSPEQARGEGHRVDGRSDIFSLGIVLYELLVGRKPFTGDTAAEIMHSVTTLDPLPPRQINDRIPRELERICLKAMSRRTADRFTTALDMAEDLRHFIETAENSADGSIPNAPEPSGSTTPQLSTDAPSQSGVSTPNSAPMPSWVAQPTPQLVPKGLRSFDRHDTEFFLELLPGARDRDGLPDSIRFWKTRIDETDADATFPVGLIYGPSGCGKSSFVKAGLLPNLGKHVTAVYVEATADETESRLLHSLVKHFPAMQDHDLGQAVAALRHGDGLGDNEKVLLVIDQFEQWLHARLERDDRELIDAIRQCDGVRVQCIVMIRDDFWMAATRFMRAVEVSLSEGQNSLAVDLFEPRHAKRVLASFGRAFGALPADAAKTKSSQTDFLEQAISEIAEDQKVVCVRLALFAEMMKGKSWEPVSLQHVGGAEGVGAAFLEETFSAKTAPPLHRFHQPAARAVLNRLLPDQGSDIKGHMRSRTELLEASGYQDRRDEFDELIRLLDGELRLITPTDPEGSDREADQPGDASYQLAHDYLVPSIRDWLTQKQKETRRGRAELRQQELAALWNAKPEKQRLPTLTEWIRIKFLTRRKRRTAAQRKMMSAASRHHSLRLGTLVCVLALVAWGVTEYSGKVAASGLIDQLLTAEMPRVPGIINQIEENGHWDRSVVESKVENVQSDSDASVRANMLLLADDPTRSGVLVERLLGSPVSEIHFLCSRINDCGVDILPALRAVIDNSDDTPDRRFNASLAIAWHTAYANLDSDSILRPHGNMITDELVDRALSRPSDSGGRMELLRPVRQITLGRLHRHFAGQDVVRRTVATGIARDYVADIPSALCDFLMDANEEQFMELFPLIAAQAEGVIPRLERELQLSIDDVESAEKKETLGRRQANAAVCLMRLGQPESAWPIFAHKKDPRARSWLVKRAAALNAAPEPLIDRLGDEPELSSQRAILLAIGNYDPQQVDKTARDLTIERCKSYVRDASDPGLRSAANWLLRTWQVNADLPEMPARLDPVGDRGWYQAPEDHTLVVIDARDAPSVGRVFDIAMTEVTIAQAKRWKPNKNLSEGYDPSEDCPVGLMTWYQAIAYCQWLNVQAGIEKDQSCYPEFDPDDPGFVVVDPDLSKTGFRLPTDEEWEFACRAGSVTIRFFGQTTELISEYAWWADNSTDYVYPVGLLKPNDYGLFDMYGNINEWRAVPRQKTVVPIGGGATSSGESRLRSGSRGGAVPTTRFNSYGLRVARTRLINE